MSAQGISIKRKLNLLLTIPQVSFIPFYRRLSLDRASLDDEDSYLEDKLSESNNTNTNDINQNAIKSFVDSFLKYLSDDPSKMEQVMTSLSTSNRSYSYQYSVFNELDDFRERYGLNGDGIVNAPDADLKALQFKIEKKTMNFDGVKNIQEDYHNIITKFLNKDKSNAKEYLKNSGLLTSEEILLINELETYALEGIMIVVLGSLFNSFDTRIPAVRASTLVDQLEKQFKFHSSIVNERYQVKEAAKEAKDATKAEAKAAAAKANEEVAAKSGKVKRNVKGTKARVKDLNQTELSPTSESHILNNSDNDTVSHIKKEEDKLKRKRKRGANVFIFGVLLLQFMIDRGFLYLIDDVGAIRSFPKQKEGKYYVSRGTFAMCRFDLSLLPIKLNLPMVCPPINWSSINKTPKTISDLRGGYLDMPTGDFYSNYRYKLLTSRDIQHFNINLDADYQKLCDVMNQLQGQSFEINNRMLVYINKLREGLVKCKLLMPQFLSKLECNKISDVFRNYFLDNKPSNSKSKYIDYLNELMERIQRARYESFVIDLATAYRGYKIYLPTYLDFRGRIYRAGVLHFHERDLSRSLLVFSGYTHLNGVDINVYYKSLLETVRLASSFHYQKFDQYQKGTDWYMASSLPNLENNVIQKEKRLSILEVEYSDLDKASRKNYNKYVYDIMIYAKKAKDPFQFLSKISSLIRTKDSKPYISLMNKLPITHDASASAYQIMGVLLLDKDLAYQTNLIQSNQINDIYTTIMIEFKKYLTGKINSDNIINIVCNDLPRKLIKRIFMPIIYGKKVNSIKMDIFEYYGTLLSASECKLVANVCNDFYNDRYPNIVNIMDLIKNIGWISAALDNPVYYKVKYYTTVQDYMKTETIKVWVYDRLQKSKRRQLSLRIPMVPSKRDRVKTTTSTFANFIHQKDAELAMSIIHDISKMDRPIPIYTVHDNFITNTFYSVLIPYYYMKHITQLKPLIKINEYIYTNLLYYSGYNIPMELPIPLDIIRNELMNRFSKKVGISIDDIEKRVRTLKSDKDHSKVFMIKIEEILNSYQKYIDETFYKDDDNLQHFYEEKMRWESKPRSLNAINLQQIENTRKQLEYHAIISKTNQFFNGDLNFKSNITIDEDHTLHLKDPHYSLHL